MTSTYTEDQHTLDAMLVCSQPDRLGMTAREFRIMAKKLAQVMRNNCSFKITKAETNIVAENVIERFDLDAPIRFKMSYGPDGDVRLAKI